jgi:hypothetical protein
LEEQTSGTGDLLYDLTHASRVVRADKFISRPEHCGMAAIIYYTCQWSALDRVQAKNFYRRIKVAVRIAANKEAPIRKPQVTIDADVALTLTGSDLYWLKRFGGLDDCSRNPMWQHLYVALNPIFPFPSVQVKGYGTGMCMTAEGKNIFLWNVRGQMHCLPNRGRLTVPQKTKIEVNQSNL